MANHPEDVHQVWALAPYSTQALIQGLSIEQRIVAYDGLVFAYGRECLWEDESDHLSRLMQALSLTMTITNTSRGQLIVGTVEEVHAHQLEEWRAMTPQDKADLFVELMRVWRLDAPGLDRTARLVKLS